MDKPIEITSPQFAVGTPDGHVDLWVQRTGPTSDIGTPGLVINGAWHGLFDGETVVVEGQDAPQPAVVLWQGRVPLLNEWEYQSALQHIQWAVDLQRRVSARAQPEGGGA